MDLLVGSISRGKATSAGDSKMLDALGYSIVNELLLCEELTYISMI